MTSLVCTSTRADAAALDDADELADLRVRCGPSPGVIRLDGSSGGPLPRHSSGRLRRLVERSTGPHPNGTTNGQQRETHLAASTLGGLLGATAEEISVVDSTSVGLFAALITAARLRPQRPTLAAGRDCLATDRYVVRSAAEFTGRRLRLISDLTELESTPPQQDALVALSHIDPHTGATRDLTTITGLVHRAGALALWDLSGTAGALDVDLHTAGVDFAIGSGYRYLGGGPGASAYLYTAAAHRRTAAPDEYRAPHPLPAGRTGPPSDIRLAELRAGLDVLDGVPPAALETKVTGLVEVFLQQLAEHETPAREITPGRSARGSQVCLRHPRAPRLAQLLHERGVRTECVDPDVLRFNFAPAWLRYVDAWDAAGHLRAALRTADGD